MTTDSRDDKVDAEVDALGLLCPLPVLKARKRLLEMAPGAVLRLVASDPAAIVDMPHFCAQAGHALLAMEESAGRVTFLIRRGG
ncbi:sulfurtransferase TusA family protein [Acidimangrovimonas pyrenivorans]|uniref:Sulfurtransferase TusA family protein n=1 Tax=Acidimangrovimonas pyrenivorans TaxID=2030798 RepID=A0ABV7AHV3_9RHOB